jgi:hypothetical protein
MKNDIKGKIDTGQDKMENSIRPIIEETESNISGIQDETSIDISAITSGQEEFEE